MKLDIKATNASLNEEIALTDNELETVLGGYGWDCSPTPPCGGGSPSYYGPSYSYGAPSYGSSFGYGSPSYGSPSGYGSPSYGSNSPFDSGSGSGCGGSTTYSVSTTTYYTGAPTPSNCGGY